LGEIDMRHPIAAMLMALALASAAPVSAQPRAATCAIFAYVIDRGARGLNIRAGPSTSARVLRVIGNEGSAVARIVGQSGAWFRVSVITNAEDDTNLFRGDGWVHSSLLGLRVANADPRLYARPSRQSRPLARLVPEDSQVTLIGCSGDWARVRAGNREGWLSRGGQCSNPVTTCV
jgi:SH3-like domain-containing protein